MAKNSRVVEDDAKPPVRDHEAYQVNNEWVPPAPDAQKPTIKVAPCLGCGHLPHPDELGCLRRRIVALTNLHGRTIEQRAETAYTLYSEDVFQASAGSIPQRGSESGLSWQIRPAEWRRVPEFFKEKWRKIVRAVV